MRPGSKQHPMYHEDDKLAFGRGGSYNPAFCMVPVLASSASLSPAGCRSGAAPGIRDAAPGTCQRHSPDPPRSERMKKFLLTMLMAITALALTAPLPAEGQATTPAPPAAPQTPVPAPTPK